VLARAARARVKWVRSSSLLLAAQESHAGQLGPRQLPCGGVVKEGTVCRAVLASQGPSSHLPHGGREVICIRCGNDYRPDNPTQRRGWILGAVNYYSIKGG